MSDTELTVSQPIVITVAVDGLDFNEVVAEIRRAAAQACGEILGCVLRAVERRAQVREPDRWVNRGQATRRLRLPWGEVTVRRTRVRDRRTGRTYNLADQLLGLRPYVRRGVEEVRTACELAVTLPYRAACHWWQRLTGLRRSVMSFWRMVQQAGQRLVDQEQDEVGEIRPGGCCCTWERATASCTRPAAGDGTRWTSRCSWKLKIYGLSAVNGLGRYSGGLT